MDDTVKVQEEFENLIDELERLKSINDLTSTNAENAKKVITQIDSFIKSTDEYKTKIEEDLDSKNKAIEELIERLNQSIKRFYEETEDLSEDVEKSIDSLTKNINEDISTKFAELEKHLSSISDQILESKTGIIKNENKSIASLEDIVTNQQKIVNKKLKNQDKEINTLKNILFLVCGLLIVGIAILIITHN